MLQDLAPDLQNAAVREGRWIGNLLAVDITAIGRIEIGDEDLAGGELEAAMAPRHVGAGQHQAASRIPANRHGLRFKPEAPAQPCAGDHRYIMAEFLLSVGREGVVPPEDRRAVAEIVVSLAHEYLR